MSTVHDSDDAHTTFDGLVKETAPRLDRVPPEPSPEPRALASSSALDDQATYHPPSHSPAAPSLAASRRLSTSLKRDQSDAGLAAGTSARTEETGTPSASLQVSPQTQSIASSAAGRGSAQEYVEVVVRLKPTATRVPDADIKYKISDAPTTSGRTGLSSSTSAITGSASVQSRGKEKATGLTPRTTRTVAHMRDVSSQVLEVWPPNTARSSTSGDASARSAVLSPRQSTLEPGADTTSRTYRFRHVLPPSVTDDEMCAKLVPEVLEQLRGQYSVCVLCYGQTGSGKTHTINALTPAVTQGIFADFVKPNTDVVELSYIQIYNDMPYNLLTGASTEAGVPSSPPDASHQRALRSARQHSVPSLGIPLRRPLGRDVCEPKRIVTSAAQVLRLVKQAQVLRCTTSHTLNARSSRAHTLMTLHITRYASGVQPSMVKVTLADLAGSERLKRSGASGETKDEAIAINGSLSALQSLVQAKVEKKSVLPVRETVLNRYLASRVMGWHLMFVVTASVEKDNYLETKSSLDFANISKDCPVTKHRTRLPGGHSPRWNDTRGTPTESDKERIRDLESEVAALRDLLFKKPYSSPTLQSAAARDVARIEGETAMAASAARWGRGGDSGAAGVVASTRLPSTASSGSPDSSPLHLSMAQCAELLCDREEELRQLSEREKNDQEQIDALREQVHERLEALRSMSHRQSTPDAAITSPRTATVNMVETEVTLRYLENCFWQAIELTDEALERLRVEERGREVVLEEKQREERRYASLEAEHAALQAAHDAAISQLREREGVVEGLKVQLLQEKLERVVGEEASQILNATVTKEVEEISVYRRQIEELRSGVAQHNDQIAMMDTELLTARSKLNSLQDQVNDRDETFAQIWALLTPQQKTRFHRGATASAVVSGDWEADVSPLGASVATSTVSTSAPLATSVSLAQSHEVIQLRSQVMALRADLADKDQALRMSEGKVRALEQRSEEQRKELVDAQERGEALRQDEERQAMVLFRMEQNASEYAATLHGLREELRRARDTLQTRAKEIERLEETQHTAQMLVNNYSARPDARSDERGTYRQHDRFTSRGGTGSPYVHTAMPSAINTNTPTTAAAAAPSGAMASSPGTGTGPRRFAVGSPHLAAATTPAGTGAGAGSHPMTSGALNGTAASMTSASATHNSAPVLANTTTNTTSSAAAATVTATTASNPRSHRPLTLTTRKELRTVAQDSDAPRLSRSGSAGPGAVPNTTASATTAATAAASPTSHGPARLNTRPAARPRVLKKAPRSVPVAQPDPPQAFTDTRRRSSSLPSSTHPSASSSHYAREATGSASEHAQPNERASRKTSSTKPAGTATRRSQTMPDTVTLRRKQSATRSQTASKVGKR